MSYLKKSITKLINYKNFIKELEDGDTKIVNSIINRKSSELYLYFIMVIKCIVCI